MFRQRSNRILYAHRWRRCTDLRSILALCICLATLTLYMNLPVQNCIKKMSPKMKSMLSNTVSGHQKGPQKQVKNPQQCLPVETNFLRRDVDLRIIIITFNRPKSVLRLLQSLNRAEYNGSKVVVEIWLDRDHQREYSTETVKIALNFVFDYGACDIHIQNHHMGINGQWLNTWRSYDNDNEIAVILEDDLTVSPYFYIWLKRVHTVYGNRSDVSGFALQGFQIRHSDSAYYLNISIENKVILYTTFATSGFSPNNKQWTEYMTWSAEIKDKTALHPKIPEHETRNIYQKMKLSAWEMQYIHYTWTHKQFTLYSNFKNNRGFTFNWNDDQSIKKGMMKNETDQRDGLILEWKHEYENLPAVPVYVNSTGVLERKSATFTL